MSTPTQRGTQHDTVTAPTSAVYTIAGSTFRESELAKQESVESESQEEVAEVFQNRGKRYTFTGTVKNGQTALRIGDLLALTFSGGTVVTTVVENAEKEGFGMVTKQQITCKKGDAETF